MAFKLNFPKFNLPKPNLSSPFAALKAALRFVIMKTIGVLLAAVFLSVAVLFLSYTVISIASHFRGRDEKIVAISSQVGKYRTAFRLGGLFQVTVEMDKKKHGKIYCLYPAWPDTFQPMKGDVIRIWPVKQPLAGAPAVEGWGWFILGSLFIVGLVMLEFAFLALMIA